MKIKILSLMLVVMFVFSSCSTKTDSTSKKVTAKATEVKKADPVTIKLVAFETTAKTQNEKLIKEFNKTNPEITVNFDYIVEGNSAEYMKKADLLLLSGDTSEVFIWPGIQDAYQRIYKNQFEPLDEYFKKENKKFEELYTLSAKNENKNYGLPGDVKMWLVLFNKSMLDAENLPLPKNDWTWDEYKDYAKKLTKGDGDSKVYGSYMHSWDTLANLGIYSTKVGTPFFKDEKTHNLDDPNLKDWLTYKFDLENKDNSQIKYFDVKSKKLAYRDLFYSKKIAMLPIGSWMIAEIKDLTKYPHDFVCAFAPLPRWKNAPEGRAVTDSLFYTINKNAKNKDAAYKFLRYYTTDGQYIKALGLSAQKGADNGKIADTMIVGSEKLYDVASLKSVLNNPKKFENVFDIVPKSDKAVKDIFMEEYEKYMVGEQDINATMANMKKRADEAVAK